MSKRMKRRTGTLVPSVRSLVAAVLVASGAACSDDPAGPGDDVLLGQFGVEDQPLELLATHAGVEIVYGCGDYFVSDEPAVLDAERQFRVQGTFYYRAPAPGSTDDARLSGFAAFGGQSVTLTFGEGGTAVDPLVITLHRGEHYTGPPLPCPA